MAVKKMKMFNILPFILNKYKLLYLKQIQSK